MFAQVMSAFTGGASGSQTISYDELAKALDDKSVYLVDVREPGEAAGGVIASATNHPLSSFNPQKVMKAAAGKPVVVYCASGARSQMAQNMLMSEGCTNVRNFRPGFGMWRVQGGKISSR